MNVNITDLIKHFSSAAAASLVMLACMASAHAAPATDTTVLSKTVNYGDLNLRSEAGAKVLYARIRGAAQDVCSPLARAPLGMHAAWQDCIDRAISTSVTQVNSSMVTALHNDSAKAARKS